MTYKQPKRKIDRYAWDNEYPAHFSYRNITLACIQCRITKRVLNYKSSDCMICPRCHNKMRDFGCKYRLPKKSDNKAWKKLERK